MIKQLKEHYPNAIVQPAHPGLDNYDCFYIEEDNVYIAIPSGDLTQRELELLNTLYPGHLDSKKLNKSKKSQEWY